MFTPDQQVISAYTLQSPQHLYRVGCFVLATINQHLENVPRVMQVMETEGSTSKQLSPNARRGMEALATEAQGLYNDFGHWQAIAPASCRDQASYIAEDAIFRLVQLPGFGIVKSAFYAQLVLGITGCLDRWNCRQAGLDERLFMRIPASAEALKTRIATYVHTVEQLGGSESLWNSWCTTISVERPARWPDAESVSKFHVTCICGEE